MIDAKDFRIGNCFFYLKEQCIVTGIKYEPVIKKYRVYLKSLETGLEIGKMQQWIEPIPLTPDVLKKCGFKVDLFSANLYHAPDDYWQVYIDDTGGVFRMPGTSLAKIKYLHQLQNLYFFISGGTEINYKPN